MAERKILNKLLINLPTDVNTCYSIKSFYMHESEYKLLNDINVKHNDCYYGKEAFSPKDLVVKLEDVTELLSFLELCNKKLVVKVSDWDDRCGFLKINSESVVPYTYIKGVKQVPLFYFEGETDGLKLTSSTCSNWDLVYLKFCCKVQGIRNELFSGDICKVVALDEIKQHFPSGTQFEDYWPKQGSIIATSSQRTLQPGSWVQKPPGVIHPVTPSTPQTEHEFQMLRARMQSTVRPTSAQTQQPKATLHPNSVYQAFQAQNLFAMRQQSMYQQHQQQMLMQQQQQQQQRQLQQARLYQSQTQSRQHPQPVHYPSLQKQRPAYRLIQIREFSYDKSLPEPPYKPQLFHIENFPVTCYNVRPHDKRDLFIPLPELVRQLFQSISLEGMHNILNQLGIAQYRGNSDQILALRQDPKYAGMETVPLLLVKDIVANLPTLRQYLSSRLAQPMQVMQQMSMLPDPVSKRSRFV